MLLSIRVASNVIPCVVQNRDESCVNRAQTDFQGALCALGNYITRSFVCTSAPNNNLTTDLPQNVSHILIDTSIH
jgi:hypothetical protein